MYEIFADLHVHIGRSENNKPIKITAAKPSKIIWKEDNLNFVLTSINTPLEYLSSLIIVLYFL